MKTVFFAFFEVYPPTSGAAAVSWDVARLWPGDTTLVQSHMRSRFERVEGVDIITVPGFSERRSGKIMGLAGRLARMVREAIRIQPDRVVLEGASWSAYHALLLRSLRGRLPNATFYYHSHNVEYELRREKHGRVVSWLTRVAEGDLLETADRVFAVSDVDREHFRRLYGRQPELLANGVDVKRFEAVPTVEVDAARERYGLPGRSLMFMGSYLYRPNGQALDFIAEHVMPEIVKAYPEACLVNTPGPVPFSAPWLRVPGLIPWSEIPSLLSACTVGLAPIFSGSGTRIKILEYMAAGVPVVATKKGAEGLGLSPEEHYLEASDGPSFVRQIERLLSGEEGLAEALTSRARAHAHAQFRWEKIIGDVESAV